MDAVAKHSKHLIHRNRISLSPGNPMMIFELQLHQYPTFLAKRRRRGAGIRLVFGSSRFFLFMRIESVHFDVVIFGWVWPACENSTFSKSGRCFFKISEYPHRRHVTSFNKFWMGSVINQLSIYTSASRTSNIRRDVLLQLWDINTRLLMYWVHYRLLGLWVFLRRCS